MIPESWRALSARIQGLVRAGQLCKPNDSLGTLKRLAEQALAVLDDLQNFATSFRDSVPPSAVIAINRFSRLILCPLT